ncbi:protein kinase [Myxococcus sp. RHSTA-1-4]|uniref:protein kinase domain-containing protein n=1 Tax=Myxococcus sp. RHSTA-1-4 TaxID=2874601 RepID=UPI001CBAE767|nr:protein kinase [Myxococcus sp. RHSTA-1-4]MBZ4423299.1 protein kinase [Myxococcus sp. RHSTA-1-4]
MSLERYEIVSELGRGGFGVVYKARQLTTGQPVAIKMLHGLRGLSEDAQKRQLARFQREMRLCAQLHHPNIIRVLDSGIMDDGNAYTAFEYIPGQNLATLLAEHGALEPIEATRLMLQVLDALCCAHSNGVIHRDLKPHNIMVSTTGARSNALVLDFGLGTLVHGPEVQAHLKLTGTRELLGTPAYAAPEQLRGQNPTPASDLFSWGLVFLECLTGVRPIRGRTWEELLIQQLGPAPIQMPPALKEHPLGRILARLLNKDPQERARLKSETLLREVEACDLRGLKLGGQDARERTMTASEQDTASIAELDQPTATRQLQVEPTHSKPAGDSLPLKQEGARRQATALCCTFTVTSSSAKELDIEESDESVRLAQQLCIEIAQSFGGSLGGILGDQILLYFGLTATPAEGALHAAHAALEFLRDLRRHIARSEQHSRVHLDVRAGIHTGHVVVRNPTHIVGTTSNAAAQLSTHALSWEIVVSADTASLLQSRFLLEPALGQQEPHQATTGRFSLRGELSPEREPAP